MTSTKTDIDIVLGEQLTFAPDLSNYVPGVQRLLRVYTLDPTLRRSDAQLGTLAIPFEPLGDTFTGARLRVGEMPGLFGPAPLKRVNLDDPVLLAQNGMKPENANPQFAQQMAYAVAAWTIERFRLALGREPDFAFPGKLTLEPFAFDDTSSKYWRKSSNILFKWYWSDTCATGATQPGSLVLAALSHDTIVHETTHALVDGVGCNFGLQLRDEIPYLFESIGDLVALFAHFAHDDLVREAFDMDGGGIGDPRLAGYGRQSGIETYGRPPLRRSDFNAAPPRSERPAPIQYADAGGEEFQNILTSAVYEAFQTVFLQKTEHLSRLRRSQPSLRWSETLRDELAAEAQRVASQFLNILIRALDYLPPLDMTFGDLLRAMITADMEVVPDDAWGYREALIYAFRRYGIRVEGVLSMGESELCWPRFHSATLNTEILRELPLLPLVGKAAADLNVRRQRGEIVRRFLLANRAQLGELGLVDPAGSDKLPIRVEIVHVVTRVGPHSRLVVNYVAQVVQGLQRVDDGTQVLTAVGGCTLIVDSDGGLRHVIKKDVASVERQQQLRKFLQGSGRQFANIFRQPDWKSLSDLSQTQMRQLLRELTHKK